MNACVTIAEPGLNAGDLELQEYDADGRVVFPWICRQPRPRFGGSVADLAINPARRNWQLSQFTRVGTTTMIGLIGYDQTTKLMPALVGKAKGLTNEGMTGYALSGATLAPPRADTDRRSLRRHRLYTGNHRRRRDFDL